MAAPALRAAAEAAEKALMGRWLCRCERRRMRERRQVTALARERGMWKGEMHARVCVRGRWASHHERSGRAKRAQVRASAECEGGKACRVCGCGPHLSN